MIIGVNDIRGVMIKNDGEKQEKKREGQIFIEIKIIREGKWGEHTGFLVIYRSGGEDKKALCLRVEFVILGAGYN